MSFFSRLLQRFRPTRYVGQDLVGNRFYEHHNALNGRPRRTVQYQNPDDMWQYIGGGKKLAIQWSSWLSHTRRNPPTLEELQQDAKRQQHMKANIALIEARDHEERALRIQQQANIAKGIEHSQKLIRMNQRQTQHSLPRSETSPQSPLPKIVGAPYEPQAWTPHTRARGGSI